MPRGSAREKTSLLHLVSRADRPLLIRLSLGFLREGNDARVSLNTMGLPAEDEAGKDARGGGGSDWLEECGWRSPGGESARVHAPEEGESEEPRQRTWVGEGGESEA